MKYWISVVSKDLVLAGLEGGFTQAAGDKADNLQLLRKGDVIFFYSPGTLFRAGKILQAFTGVARVAADAPYPVKGPAKVRRWRLDVTTIPCEEAPIEPLIPALAFVDDKTAWNTSLHRGIFEIGKDDARSIASAMKADSAVQ